MLVKGQEKDGCLRKRCVLVWFPFITCNPETKSVALRVYEEVERGPQPLASPY